MFRLLTIFCFLPLLLASCPGNGIEWQSKCYYFIKNVTAFVTADLDCINRGGHLASIHDGFTNAFVGQEAMLQIHESTVSDIWIGATSYINPGNWSWTDGTNFTFSHLKNNTAIPSESCIALVLSNGIWNTNDCFKEKPYVCAINNLQTTTTTEKSTTSVYPSCRSNWYYYNETYSCYFYTPETDWSSAEEYCQAFEGHLTSIHSQTEMDFITSSVNPNKFNYWIGLHSTDNKATWIWTDNSAVNYINWATYYPQTSNCTCVLADDQFRNLLACSKSNFQGICKRSAFLDLKSA
uniref:C-type lectin domain-containing protein n=1 Tax=Panagrolaimus davidi TaxID=227884 RepID=A0A914R0A0_9BILA